MPELLQNFACGRKNATQQGYELIETEDTIFLFKFKLDGSAEDVLKQIDGKDYTIQYDAGDKQVIKIGVNFDKERRTI